jgi:hypothetical protein
LGAKSSR